MKKKRRMPLKNFVRRNGRMLIGGTIIAVLVVMAIFAPIIATHDPDAYDYTNRFALPSLEHLLGTDTHGRDIFSRMVYGTRISLLLGFGVNFLVVCCGAFCGILCGYFKRVDSVLMRVMEGLHALPTTLLAMVVASVLGPGIPFADHAAAYHAFLFPLPDHSFLHRYFRYHPVRSYLGLLERRPGPHHSQLGCHHCGWSGNVPDLSPHGPVARCLDDHCSVRIYFLR